MLLDLKYAFRQLAKNRGFTAVVVLTLALGVGANTAIFSFFNGVLLRPLPFKDPDHAIVFQQAPGRSGSIRSNGVGLYTADFLDLRKNSQTLLDAATYSLNGVTLTGVGEPDAPGCAIVSDNYFTVLGSSALFGRVFTPEDTRTHSGRLAVLSYAYWENKFGGSPDAVGRLFAINGVSFTVVGVMPPDFQFPAEAKLFASPANLVPESRIGFPSFDAKGRGDYVRTIIGRLRPGVSIAQAQAELAGLVRGLPNPNQMARPVYLVTLRHQILGEIRPVLATLLGCVGLLLLIACMNIANLLLARAVARRHEMGLRLALGASRWQLLRHTLTETMVLALLGGGIGVALGFAGTRLLTNFAPANVPRLAVVHVDGWVLGFTLGLSLLTGICLGLVPALEMFSTDLGRSLSEGLRGGTAGAERRRLRSILVATEVAVSLVLLVAAGLLLRSFERMLAVPWGIEPSHVITMRVGFYDPRFAPSSIRKATYRKLLDQLEAEAGFESVSLSFDMVGTAWQTSAFVPEGQAFRNPADTPVANYHSVSTNYFRTLGIPLLAGRVFTANDDEHGRRVAIIDANLAHRFFPDGQPVGKRILIAWNSDLPIDPMEIVGVVGNVKSNGPEAAPGMDFYLSLSQAPSAGIFIIVRTPLAPAASVAAVKRVVGSIDPSISITSVAVMDDLIAQPAMGRRFPLMLIGAFAGLALFLAAIGIYAVVSYSVVQRTREIGIRMALGARAQEVTNLVLRQSGIPIVAGLCVGMGGSAIMAFAMRKLLFEVPPLDAGTFIIVPLILGAIAAFACWLPARRAARVDPLIALRTE